MADTAKKGDIALAQVREVVQKGVRPDAAAFETSITFTPITEYNPVVAEHQSPLVSFGYDEVARSRFTPLRRTFNLGDFPPGRYRLTVAAHLPDGPAVTRATTIRVLGANEQR